MVEAVANVGGWRHGDAEFAGAVEDWNDVLRAVPFEELPHLRQIGLASGKTKAPEFLALWKASFVIPISVKVEEEERRTERERFELEREAGKYVRPAASQIFSDLGRAVVCACRFDERPLRAGFNDRFTKNMPVPAQIVQTSDGPRWRCARGQCALDVDANKVGEVRGASILPLADAVSNFVATTHQERAPSSGVTQSRAELLAESVNVVWENCTPTQQADLKKMARWLDWQRPQRDVRPEAFGALWDESQRAI